jgi:hypothetical protein
MFIPGKRFCCWRLSWSVITILTVSRWQLSSWTSSSFGVTAQDTGLVIGTDICFCQPATYKIRLNFRALCSESTVNETIPGIVEASCQTTSRTESENLTDPYAILINEVQILELDQNFSIVGQTVYTDPLNDGDIIEYTSIVYTDPEKITPESLPQGFQITIQAINSLEEPLSQTSAILYSNDCGIFPLLQELQQIGWNVFVSSFVLALLNIC